MALVDCTVGCTVVGSAGNVVVITAAELVDTVTPGLVVGMVTLDEVVVKVFTSVIVDVGLVVVVEGLILGHKAARIPPCLTIPNSVLEDTLSAEQALLTHEAFEVKAD